MQLRKLKFTETKELPVYRAGMTFKCFDGDIVDVKEDQAKQLLKDFPKNFELVKELTKSEIVELEKAKKKKEEEAKKKEEEERIAKAKKDKDK